VQSFRAASSNFELAIAVANSNQTLVATVGSLIEIPLLSLVHLMKYLKKRWVWGMDKEAVDGNGSGEKSLSLPDPSQV
jgi:ACR3 family arsenite efflux pump ArsB